MQNLFRNSRIFLGSIQRSCSSENLIRTTYFAEEKLLSCLVTGKAKTGWFSDIVTYCYRNLSSHLFMEICNFVRVITIRPGEGGGGGGLE